MVSITAAGSASGLDVEQIIETLTEVEEAPEKARIDTREIEIQADISAYGSLKGALEDFRSAVTGLSTLGSINSRSAASSDEEKFTATATSAAAVGTSTIEVEQLATSHKIRTTTTDFSTVETTVGSGTLTISQDGESFNLTITAGVNDTLTQVRDAINDASDNTGVTASIIQEGTNIFQLVLSSDNSGADNAITVTVDDDDGVDDDNAGLSRFAYDPDALPTPITQMNQLNPAQDAQIEVDGFATFTSSTNVFEDAIPGVTITAIEQMPVGVPETLTISLDQSNIQTELSEFVAAFNTLADTFDFLTDYDPVEREAGLLTGDFVARTIESQIRRGVTTRLEGLSGVYDSLASLGITTQRDGRLSIDQSKLSSALNNDLTGVAELLADDDGIMSGLDDTLSTFLTTGGLLDTRNDTFQEQLKDLDNQREKLGRRIIAFEERIRRQYTSMDILVGQLQSTGNFVVQQLGLIKAGGAGDD